MWQKTINSDLACLRKSYPKQRNAWAFTLVELLVAISAAILLLLMMTAMTEQAQQTLQQTSSRIEAFREARGAFDAMTRRIGQATLNTYWDYDDANQPYRYLRQSELRFRCGNAQDLVGNARPGQYSGQALFFQGLLGETNQSATHQALSGLVNTWGYFVEYNDDQEFRPPFLETVNPAIPLKSRFRLMELREPSERLTIYEHTDGNPDYAGNAWFEEPLGNPADMHVLAENILILVMQPKRSDPDKGANSGQPIAPDYEYNSAPSIPRVDPQPVTEHQLPPLIQVTMVALDEGSASRLEEISDDPIADLGLNTLFTDTANYEADLETLENVLTSQGLSFRTFSTEVSLRGAKWSQP